MDIVFITDLDIDTVIGIYDWEREIKQTVRLNIEMNADVAKAALTDHIDDTLDYKAVAKRLIGFVEQSEFGLVETLAERCTEIIRNEFPVQWVRFRLDKLGAVTGSRSVGILIERGQKPLRDGSGHG
ncbi:MAG TPA: dihydroneopterin aldolase [Wenzhouxiangella sp.]